MDRRKFLVAFVATAGLALISKPLVELIPVAPLPLAIPPTYPELTLAELECAYQSVCFGYEEPTLILVSESMWPEIHQLWEKGDIAKWSHGDRDCPNLVFNSAAITPHPEVPKRSIYFINENHPDDVRLNTVLEIDDGDRRD